MARPEESDPTALRRLLGPVLVDELGRLDEVRTSLEGVDVDVDGSTVATVSRHFLEGARADLERVISLLLLQRWHAVLDDSLGVDAS